MATYALEPTWRPLLKDLGVSTAAVLRRAGLPDDLMSRPGVRLGAPDFHRFWDGLLTEMADPLTPLRLCQALKADSFSPLLFAALCSPNLLVAIRRIAAYKPLVAPIRLTLSEAPRHVTVTLVWPGAAHPPPPSLVLTELLFFVALARMGTRQRIDPLGMVVNQPPQPLQAYTAYLGVAVRKGRSHEVRFARQDALQPFLTSDEGLWSAFEPALRTRLAQLEGTLTLAQRVRCVLLEALPSGLSDMDAVAGKLAMSRRSLQRHLQSEGVSYQRVLQETRLLLARHYLQNTDLAAAQISFLLGFEEPNSFYRAFRHWTGQTPAAARQQAMKE